MINTIQKTYPFYLGKSVRIIVNGNQVEGEDLNFGQSEQIKPAIDSWEDGNVKATLICGLLPREDLKWTFDKSGWYILCNGRVIVHADKTILTGWGVRGLLPQFMPKHRGFLGVVFLKSDRPEELPWNTKKRGVNSESAVYIRTLKRMNAFARVVIQFQNKIYEGTEVDEPREEFRDSIKRLQSCSATRHAAEVGLEIKTSETQTFLFKSPPLPKMTTINFKVRVEDITRVKKSLGRVSMPNYKVGEMIFKYYLDRECSK